LENRETIHHVVENLFRHEYGKLVSVLTKIFGPHNLQLSEDVVQETLLTAMNRWKISGVPDNPSGWLFTAARNKAVDLIRRQKKHQQFAASIEYLLRSEYTLSATVDGLMNMQTINDDQLRMMFACCHPSLPVESQVALILKTLCGFSILEISRAFLTSDDTIEKRLYRAKQRFRQEVIAFEIPPANELEERLKPVLTSIYLLFNEGYNSTNHDQLIRKDLIEESLRLSKLLLENKATKQPQVFALLALICFNMARTDARLDEHGNILLMEKQDRQRWDRSLLAIGYAYLDQSAEGEELTTYHIEAAIAWEHVSASSYSSTNWKNILRYYDLLYKLRPAAIVALNRAVAVSEIYGPAEGIKSIQSLPDISSLKNYYLLHSILGELHLRLHENEIAISYFTEASRLTASGAEKKLLAEKIRILQEA
jgi:RNA polymerase sigma factor (sigma-70 family)